MNAKPPPPKFEKVPEDGEIPLTEEDEAFLQALERAGLLPFQGEGDIEAYMEAERERMERFMRRAGFDPDAPQAIDGDN